MHHDQGLSRSNRWGEGQEGFLEPLIRQWKLSGSPWEKHAGCLHCFSHTWVQWVSVPRHAWASLSPRAPDSLGVRGALVAVAGRSRLVSYESEDPPRLRYLWTEVPTGGFRPLGLDRTVSAVLPVISPTRSQPLSKLSLLSSCGLGIVGRPIAVLVRTVHAESIHQALRPTALGSLFQGRDGSAIVLKDHRSRLLSRHVGRSVEASCRAQKCRRLPYSVPEAPYVCSSLLVLSMRLCDCSSELQAHSTPAYLGRYIRAFSTTASTSARYAFGGVWSVTPPLRPRGRPSLFHRRAAPPTAAQIQGIPFSQDWRQCPYSAGRAHAGSRPPAWVFLRSGAWCPSPSRRSAHAVPSVFFLKYGELCRLRGPLRRLVGFGLRPHSHPTALLRFQRMSVWCGVLFPSCDVPLDHGLNVRRLDGHLCFDLVANPETGANISIGLHHRFAEFLPHALATVHYGLKAKMKSKRFQLWGAS